jgi:hypothetical protein
MDRCGSGPGKLPSAIQFNSVPFENVSVVHDKREYGADIGNRNQPQRGQNPGLDGGPPKDDRNYRWPDLDRRGDRAASRARPESCSRPARVRPARRSGAMFPWSAPAILAGDRHRRSRLPLSEHQGEPDEPRNRQCHRSTSPRTMSMLPRITTASAIVCPKHMSSSTVRLIKLGGRTRYR